MAFGKYAAAHRSLWDKFWRYGVGRYLLGRTLNAIGQYLCQSVWKCIWIIYEVMFVPRLSVWCGYECLPWSAFRKAIPQGQKTMTEVWNSPRALIIWWNKGKRFLEVFPRLCYFMLISPCHVAQALSVSISTSTFRFWAFWLHAVSSWEVKIMEAFTKPHNGVERHFLVTMADAKRRSYHADLWLRIFMIAG
jgi:hypothetical protein